jgi:hypothetical protein
LTNRYDDPHYQPPADLSEAEARLYEQKIVELLCEVLLPSDGPSRVSSVELRGTRPDTEIMIRWRRAGDPSLRASRAMLWKSEYPTSGAAEYGSLHEAASVAGWIYSDWDAGDLEPIEVDEPESNG